MPDFVELKNSNFPRFSDLFEVLVEMIPQFMRSLLPAFHIYYFEKEDIYVAYRLCSHYLISEHTFSKENIDFYKAELATQSSVFQKWIARFGSTIYEKEVLKAKLIALNSIEAPPCLNDFKVNYDIYLGFENVYYIVDSTSLLSKVLKLKAL